MYPALTSLNPMSTSLSVSLPSRAPPATVRPIPTIKSTRDTTKHCRICRLMFRSRATLQCVLGDWTITNISMTPANSHDSNKAQGCCDQGKHASIEKDDGSYHHASTGRLLWDNDQNSSSDTNWKPKMLDTNHKEDLGKILTDGEESQDNPRHARSLVPITCEIKCSDRYRYIEHNLCYT